jgi:3-hydroxymyristoyl/3-hydroxydecanoyl-(acyl carrier protein) dehydratase
MRLTDEIRIDAQACEAEASFLVREDADFLADHFPGAPMLPGLLMLEMAVCAAAALWDARRAGDPHFAAELETVEHFRVVRRVVPNETLIVKTRLVELETEHAMACFETRAKVACETVMRARFRLRALTGGANERVASATQPEPLQAID